MTLGNMPDVAGMPQVLRDWLNTLRQEVVRPRRPLYIPVTHFSGYHSLDKVGLFDIAFCATGFPKLSEIDNLGIVAARMEALADECHHLWYVPPFFNIDTNIKFSVVWCTNSNTLTDSVTWGLKYESVKEGETMVGATNALDEVITADTVLGSYVLAVSPYGLMYKSIMEHGDMLHFKISLDAVSGLDPAVSELYLMGLLINDEG